MTAFKMVQFKFPTATHHCCPRRDSAGFSPKRAPLTTEGPGKPGADPRSLACKNRKHASSSPQVHRQSPAFPRDGFNLLRGLPGERLGMSGGSGFIAPALQLRGLQGAERPRQRQKEQDGDDVDDEQDAKRHLQRVMGMGSRKKSWWRRRRSAQTKTDEVHDDSDVLESMALQGFSRALSIEPHGVAGDL